MLLVWLKKKEEFQKLCQGKAVFFAVNDNSVRYFTPIKANDVEVLFAFDSDSTIPFREHYDLGDTEGTHVQQLIEIEGLYSFDFGNPVYSEMTEKRMAEAY